MGPELGGCIAVDHQLVVVVPVHRLGRVSMDAVVDCVPVHRLGRVSMDSV